MNEAKRSRVLLQARVMLESKLTVREVAKIIGLSKSTIHKDLTEKLKYIDEAHASAKADACALWLWFPREVWYNAED